MVLFHRVRVMITKFCAALCTLIAGNFNEPQGCVIDAVIVKGVTQIHIHVNVEEAGVLSFNVVSTLISGTNKSRSVTGGDIVVTQGLGMITIWKGSVLASQGYGLKVSARASLNGSEISCAGRYP